MQGPNSSPREEQGAAGRRGGRGAAASGFRGRKSLQGRAGVRTATGTPWRRKAAPPGGGAGPAPGRKPTGDRRAHPGVGRRLPGVPNGHLGVPRASRGPYPLVRRAPARAERPRAPRGRGGGERAARRVRRRQVLTDRPSRLAEPLLPVRGSRRPHHVRSGGRAGGRRRARSRALPGGDAGVRGRNQRAPRGGSRRQNVPTAAGGGRATGARPAGGPCLLPRCVVPGVILAL